MAPSVASHWYIHRKHNESWVLDRDTERPIIFIACGWVTHSDLKSYRIDIDPVQPDWKASMINFCILFDDMSRSMAEYSWEGVPGPAFSSVRFGAPIEHYYQGKI